MSNLETRIVDTPIELSLIDNVLSLQTDSEEVTIMESNSYPVKISTNEILKGCSLVMKQYGGNELKKIENDLEFGTTRLILVSILDNNNENEIKKICWGTLEKDLSIISTPPTYTATLSEYGLIEEYGLIPGIKKVNEVILDTFGRIEGKLIEDSDGNFSFYPTKFEVNEEDKKYKKDWTENEKVDSIIVLKQNGENEEEMSIKIKVELEKDFSKIPNPPKIDDELIPPEKINFNFEEIVTNASNPLLDGFILSFENYTLDFSSYEESQKLFRFSNSFSFPSEGNLIKFEQLDISNENEKIIEAVIKYKEVDGTTPCLKIKKQVLNDEVENYQGIFGNLTINLDISKEDLLKYRLKIDYSLTLSGKGEVEKTDSEGNFCYYLPEKEYIYEDIQKVERDGTGEYFMVEQPIYRYENDTLGTPALDEFGRKIPIFERDENGKLILDEEGYAKYKVALDENGNPQKEIVNEIEYVRDSYGQIVYELIPVKIYERNEDNSLYIDETTNLPTVVAYELTEQGNIIYEKRPTPQYVVDGNNEVEKDENGEMKLVYKQNGTGEILYNNEGEPILAFEKDIYGSLILDDEDNPIPIYETTEEIDKESGEIIVVNKKGIVGWKPKVDSFGEISYIKDDEGNIKEFTSNLVQKYEKENINGRDYYKVDEYNELIPIQEEQDGILKNIYEKDSSGEFLIVSGYNQLMTMGDIFVEAKSEIINTVNVTVFYNNFSYSQEEVDKDEFVSDEYLEGINNYTGVIPAENLPGSIEKILIGIAKYEKVGQEEEKITFATNGIELKVKPSIITMVWEPKLDFLNEKVVVANYSSEDNWYYEISSTLENPIWLEGKENYIYVDAKDIKIKSLVKNSMEIDELESITIRKWRPDDGFYILNLASEKNLR